MKLKMRIVLFCMLLLAGREMRADCTPRSRVSIEDFNWFTSPRPLILLDLAITGGEKTPLVFSHRRPVVFCAGDTILLEALDSVRTQLTEQWLLRPVRNMLKDSVYHFFFSSDTNFWANYLSDYNLYRFYDYTLQYTGGEPDVESPKILKQPRLVKSEYGVSSCPTISAFTVLFPCEDSSRMLVKAVLTDIETGRQSRGYAMYYDSLHWFEETVCASPFPVNPRSKYHVQLTVFDMAGNKTTADVPGVLWFSDHQTIDFSLNPEPPQTLKWIIVTGAVLLLTGLVILLRWARKRT